MRSEARNTGYEIYESGVSKLSYEMFVLIGLILVYIGRIQEIFGFLTPLHIGLIFQALAIPVIMKRASNQQFRVIDVEAPEMKILMSLFIYGFVSAIFSHYLKASVTFMFSSFSRNVFFFLLVVNVVKSWEDLRRAVWSYAIAVIILAMPSVFSHTSGRWASLDASYDANDIALLIVTTLPFIYHLIPQTKGLKKVALLAAIPVLLNALVATGSRGGFLGLIAVMGLLFFRSRMNFIKKTGIVVIFALSFFYLAPASYHERITTIGESEDYNQTDNFGRINIWKRSLEMIAKNPVFGVGPGCFAIASGFTYAQEVGGAAWNMTTHNSFLLIAVEMGVFGGYLYLAFLVRSLMAMRRVLRETNQPEMDEYVWLARALEAAFVGFLVSGFFLSFCYKPVSYFFVGLVIAYRFRLAVLLKGDDMDGAVVHP